MMLLRCRQVERGIGMPLPRLSLWEGMPLPRLSLWEGMPLPRLSLWEGIRCHAILVEGDAAVTPILVEGDAAVTPILVGGDAAATRWPSMVSSAVGGAFLCVGGASLCPGVTDVAGLGEVTAFLCSSCRRGMGTPPPQGRQFERQCRTRHRDAAPRLSLWEGMPLPRGWRRTPRHRDAAATDGHVLYPAPWEGHPYAPVQSFFQIEMRLARLSSCPL